MSRLTVSATFFTSPSAFVFIARKDK